MIIIKSENEIKAMTAGGKILAEVLSKALAKVKPGVTEMNVEKFAEGEILRNGAYPAFKKVPGYKYATCISTNDVVVHGIPTSRTFKEGDIVGIDCGVFYKGFYTDMAETIKVQNSKIKSQNLNEIDKFLETGKKALNEAIKQAKLGNRIGHISETIQSIVEKGGYSVVRSLVGHGVGKSLHEDPEIPGFLNEDIDQTPLLKEGMTLAIEVIYNMGKSAVMLDQEDGWTIKTKDKSISGLFERTVLVAKNGPIIITA